MSDTGCIVWERFTYRACTFPVTPPKVVLLAVCARVITMTPECSHQQQHHLSPKGHLAVCPTFNPADHAPPLQQKTWTHMVTPSGSGFYLEITSGCSSRSHGCTRHSIFPSSRYFHISCFFLFVFLILIEIKECPVTTEAYQCFLSEKKGKILAWRHSLYQIWMLSMVGNVHLFSHSHFWIANCGPLIAAICPFIWPAFISKIVNT